MLKTKCAVLVGALVATSAVLADNGRGCQGLPNHSQLEAALTGALGGNGGFEFPMWGTIVNRSGEVCAVAKTGDAWPGSRVISAQKANTANAFSSSSVSLSTANLYSAVQPGGSLFGLQESNPVNPFVAYRGRANQFGTPNDPMNGLRIGGVNVFGGGLALYAPDGKTVVGGVGVSGDTSCADHNIAWKVRAALGFVKIVGGVAPDGTDNIIYDIANGESVGGFGHPKCNAASVAPAANVTK
ncbi:MAG: heme-binding protein [Lautropia sp.]|nr:heme-binding protein [Lautropia sp.]